MARLVQVVRRIAPTTFQIREDVETGSGRSEFGDPEVHPGVLGLSEPVTEGVSLNLRLVTAHRHWSISRSKDSQGYPLLKLSLNLPPQKVDSCLLESYLKDLWDAFA